MTKHSSNTLFVENKLVFISISLCILLITNFIHKKNTLNAHYKNTTKISFLQIIFLFCKKEGNPKSVVRVYARLVFVSSRLATSLAKT